MYLNSFNHQKKGEYMDEKVSKEKQKRLFNKRSREQQDCATPRQNKTTLISLL